MKVLYIVGKTLKHIFSLTAGFIGIFLVLALLPIENNYKLLIVQSGSMEPTVPVGSLVLVLPKLEYETGDVVTFAPNSKDPTKYVTHRISGFADDSVGLVYETKGDANKTPDPAPLNKENIVGKVLLTIPFIGIALNFTKTPLGFILVVIVPATIVIYEETKKLYESARNGARQFIHKRKKSGIFTKEDDAFLKDIGELRQRISLNPKILMFILCFGVSFAFAGYTAGFFSDTEIGGATFAAAIGSPSPSVSPGSSPSPLPAHIVINEVFYDVDGDHGLDSPGDRSITIGGHVTQVRIENNGVGSTNTAFVDFETLCKAIQINSTESDINLNVNGNTGGNQSSGNTGGNSSTSTGNATNNININVTGGSNTLSDFCTGISSRNHEWIEIYNPTSQTVNLKDWTVTDNSGITVTINGNRFLGAGKFALISKSNSTWSFWDEPSSALKIPLGRQIGDGLDDAGDHLLLKNPAGELIDAMSYGDHLDEFLLIDVAEGHSLEREADGVDTNTALEWLDRFFTSAWHMRSASDKNSLSLI